MYQVTPVGSEVFSLAATMVDKDFAELIASSLVAQGFDVFFGDAKVDSNGQMAIHNTVAFIPRSPPVAPPDP